MQPISTSAQTMKHHHLDTADHRTTESDHSIRKLSLNTRVLQKTGSFPLREQRGSRNFDRHLRKAQELRYQVYCLEFGFLSPDDYPDGVESDEHDARAAHFYAFDAQLEVVGYVRLVRPDVDQRFPFQDHCATSTGGVTLPAPCHAAEISRLMVRHDYRRLRASWRTSTTTRPRNSIHSADRRDAASQVLLSLYRQMYLFSRSNGIGHWYAAMEQPLARSLLRLKLTFQPIGPQTDYYGPVAPYLANLHELEAQVGAGDPALLAWLQEA